MKVLKGFKVVDLSTYAAGPACSRILADWGADVIKIEPIAGEPFRLFGKSVGMPIGEDENPAYEIDNANKKALPLNLKTEEGQNIIHRLIKDADILVTNYRYKALRKLNLDYETLSKMYPKLVYGLITGFGTKGEMADYPGFDFTAYWARGGIMASLGEPDAIPITGLPGYGDQAAGAFLAGGVAAALVGREKNGIGEKVEVSLYHTAIWCTSEYISASNYWENGKKTRFNPTNPLVNFFKCKDSKWFSLCLFEYDRYWPRLCKCLDLEDVKDDPRFKTFDDALNNSAEQTKVFDNAFMKRDSSEWTEIFAKEDIPSQILFDANDINADKVALDNDYLRMVTFRNGNTLPLATSPCQFTSSGPSDWRLSPRFGENTHEVMQSLGYSEDEIKALEDKNIIKSR